MVIARPNKSASNKQSAIGHLATRCQYEQILNRIGEFLDVTDHEAADDVKHLYAAFNRLDSVMHDDEKSRRRMKRNVRAVITLIRTVRQHGRSGLRWARYIKDERVKWVDCLLQFVRSSDEDAGSWIEHLFTEYLCSPEFAKDGCGSLYRIRLNINEASELARAIHEHHKSGAMDRLAK